MLLRFGGQVGWMPRPYVGGELHLSILGALVVCEAGLGCVNFIILFFFNILCRISYIGDEAFVV